MSLNFPLDKISSLEYLNLKKLTFSTEQIEHLILPFQLFKYDHIKLKRKNLSIVLVGSQFVVQTYSIMAQWAQDNKFVESGLENWALMNLGNNYHKFKEDLN